MFVLALLVLESSCMSVVCPFVMQCSSGTCIAAACEVLLCVIC